MKRTLAIILSVTVWCAIVAYLVFATRMCTGEQGKTVVSQVDITVEDDGAVRVVTPETIKKLLRDKGYELTGEEVDKVNTERVREYLESHAFVRHARVYTDMSGKLSIEVVQRRPVLRVNTYNGYNFYVSDDGWIMPVQPGGTVYVPIITGSFAMPFEQGFGGDLGDVEKALEEKDRKARQELNVELNKLVMKRRELDKKEQPFRNEYNKKLRKLNKKRDSLERVVLTTKLKEEEMVRRKPYYGELRKLEKEKRELYEKEWQRLAVQKKEEEKYLYLRKLINFVELISNDTFWDAQIVQINVRTPGGTGGSVYWKEPEVEIVPRIGKHIVILGTLDGAEQKLDKLMMFYENVLDHEGWDTYRSINLKYKGQIVCRR